MKYYFNGESISWIPNIDIGTQGYFYNGETYGALWTIDEVSLMSYVSLMLMGIG